MFESLQLCFIQSHISHNQHFRWCHSEMSARKVVDSNFLLLLILNLAVQEVNTVHLP